MVEDIETYRKNVKDNIKKMRSEISELYEKAKKTDEYMLGILKNGYRYSDEGVLVRRRYVRNKWDNRNLVDQQGRQYAERYDNLVDETKQREGDNRGFATLEKVEKAYRDFLDKQQKFYDHINKIILDNTKKIVALGKNNIDGAGFKMKQLNHLSQDLLMIKKEEQKRPNKYIQKRIKDNTPALRARFTNALEYNNKKTRELRNKLSTEEKKLEDQA